MVSPRRDSPPPGALTWAAGLTALLLVASACAGGSPMTAEPTASGPGPSTGLAPDPGPSTEGTPPSRPVAQRPDHHARRAHDDPGPGACRLG